MTPPTLAAIADSLARYQQGYWLPDPKDRYFQEQVLAALEPLLRAHAAPPPGDPA